MRVSLLLVLTCGVSAAYTFSSYPDPTQDPGRCGRKGPHSWVCDPDHIISTSKADELEATLGHISQIPQDSCAQGGYQMAIALMKKMDEGIGATRDVAVRAKMFAQHLHDKWGVGQKGCNNGILLLLSRDDRRIFISTGRQSREKLSDKRLDKMVDDAKVLLRGENYGAAVQQVANDIALVLEGQELPDRSSSAGLWILGLVFLAFCYQGWKSHKDAAQYKRCTRLLEGLEKAKAQALAANFQATSCPICLEDFAPTGSHQPQQREEEGREREMQQADVVVLMEGYLNKKSHASVKGMRWWQKRYFVLTPSSLTYWKKKEESKKESTPMGVVEVKNISLLCGSTKSPVRFDLHLSNPRNPRNVKELQAGSAQECSQWVRAFRTRGVPVEDGTSVARGEEEEQLALAEEGGHADAANHSQTQSLLSSSSSSSSSSQQQGGLETHLLRCGHTFCSPCISEHFKNSNLCPICRQPANNSSNNSSNDDDDNDDDRDNDNASSSSSSFFNNRKRARGEVSSSSSSSRGRTYFSIPNSFSYGGSSRHYGDGVDFQQELAFRLARMHHYYPQYVTRSMADRWAQPDFTGSMHTDPAFVATNPELRSEGQHGSSSSSSGGFGGGGCGGGGGGGGGW